MTQAPYKSSGYYKRRKKRLMKIRVACHYGDWVPVVWDSSKQKYVKCNPEDTGGQGECFDVRCVHCGHILKYNSWSAMGDHELALNKAGRKCKKKKKQNDRIIIRHKPFG